MQHINLYTIDGDRRCSVILNKSSEIEDSNLRIKITMGCFVICKLYNLKPPSFFDIRLHIAK